MPVILELQKRFIVFRGKSIDIVRREYELESLQNLLLGMLHLSALSVHLVFGFNIYVIDHITKKLIRIYHRKTLQQFV